MEAGITENLRTTIFMERESMSGLIRDSILGIGSSTRCGGLESSHGLIRESMRENIMMTRSKAKGNSPGLMEEFILEDGTMESSMVSESTRR